MSVGMAYVGGQISQSFAPYLDKVTAVITSNSVLQGAIVNGLSTGISGFILNLSTSYLDNGNANDAFSNGLKGFAQGFTMGAGQSLVQSGYNYVKSRTVKSPINAIESKAEPTGKKDLAAQVQKGKDGEIAAGIDPNAPKEKIVVDSRTRIPDELDHKYKTLTEVKNVKSQSFTKQLRDFHQYSLDNGYKMILYMPEGHPVTKPLQQQFDNGTIIRLNLKF